MNRLNLLARILIKPVDQVLDKLTSYKLILYFLYVIVGWSILASFVDQVAYPGYKILWSAVWLILVCKGVNALVSRHLNVPTNHESYLVTALILTLILTPASSVNDFLVLGAAAGSAMLSKYIFVINRWHIFNPAAMGAFISGFVFHDYASWWIGTSFITPVVFIGGMLILRKMKRFTMVIVFELVALAAIAMQTYLNQSGSFILHNLWTAIISTALLFFAYVMLTEPLTSPRLIQNYIPYAVLVGFLYGYTKLGISPEEALLLGNIFTYLFEPNRRMELKFKRKIREAEGIESFIFSGKNNFKYKAGQYLEWTIEDHKSDFRGNRRYLTISSSPTEKDLMFTVRMPSPASSFKQKLEQLKPGDPILAAQLSGTFTLPQKEKQKLVFLAGGVGVTPFRSMVKYVVDFEQQRDIHILYSANKDNEFSFKNLFEEAKKFGVEVSYVTGLIDKQKIQDVIPDFSERTFYISGPYGFVHAMESNLLSLGLPTSQIKIDYFPGYGN